MLLALEKESGEVIVTPWTMSATVMIIIQAGFVPVFVDIDKESFTKMNCTTTICLVQQRTRIVRHPIRKSMPRTLA